MTYPIYYGQMTQNRLSETRHCIEKYLPYVEKIILVDGGSNDDSIFFFRNWASIEPKIEFYLCPWQDHFSNQRNNYLCHVPDNAWALVSDPDEIFEDNTLQNLQALIAYAESHGKDMVGFQCRSTSYKGPKKVHESLDNYWKRLLFKKYPGTHYVGNPHESLANHPHKIMDTKFLYEHTKQENLIWHRGMRNYIVNGGGPNLSNKNPHWIKLRDLMRSIGITTWHDFEKYCLKGNIDQRIKDEFIYYITLKEVFPGMTDGLSEMKEAFKTYYFIWHPEEIPPSLKGISIP